MTTPTFAQELLKSMDAECAKAEAWPIFYGTTPDRAYNAMRMIVLLQKGGDGFALYYEVLEGSSLQTLFNCRYVVTYGHSVCLNRNAFSLRKVPLEEVLTTESSVTIQGPRGVQPLTVSMDALEKLEPLRATALETKDTRYSLLVRAYLQAYPDFWHSTVESALDDMATGIQMWPEGYDVLLTTKSFEHIVGNASVTYDPDGVDRQWRVMPSQSSVYQSLAEAIDYKDASRFKPGNSNLDWRLHLDQPNPQRTYKKATKLQ